MVKSKKNKERKGKAMMEIVEIVVVPRGGKRAGGRVHSSSHVVFPRPRGFGAAHLPRSKTEIYTLLLGGRASQGFPVHVRGEDWSGGNPSR